MIQYLDDTGSSINCLFKTMSPDMPITMNPDESPQLQQRTTSNAEEINETKPSAAQLENVEEADLQKFKLSKTGGDVALALFDNVGGIHDPIDPEEDRKLVRKVDWMILPYISVCYAFFYVSLSVKCLLASRQEIW